MINNKNNNNNIYQENGYKNRKDYLKCLSENYGIDLDVVYTLANILGEQEDFDGLVAELSDLEYMQGEM